MAARTDVAGGAYKDVLAVDHAADAFPSRFLDRFRWQEVEAAPPGLLDQGLRNDMTRGLIERGRKCQQFVLGDPGDVTMCETRATP